MCFCSPTKKNPSPSPVMSLGVAGCFSLPSHLHQGVSCCGSGHPKHHFGITLGDTWWGSVSFWSCLVILADRNGRLRVCDGPRLCWHCAVLLYHTVPGFSALLLLPESAELCAHLLNGCVAPASPPSAPCFSAAPARRDWQNNTTLPPAARTCAFTPADSAATVLSKRSRDTHGECES